MIEKTYLVRERVVNSHKVVPNYTYSLNTTVIKEHVYHDGTKNEASILNSLSRFGICRRQRKCLHGYVHE